MTPIQIRALEWRDTVPDSAGLWLMRCLELDNKPEEVRVFEREEGVWLAEDPHLGIIGLQALHDGLTRTQWARKNRH